MKTKNYFIAIVSIIIMLSYSSLAFSGVNPDEPAKKSTVSGKVVDKVSGENLAGVLVTIKGSDIKAYTDLNGNFTLNGVVAGDYTLVVDYISYATNEIENVSFNGEKNSILQIAISPK